MSTPKTNTQLPLEDLEKEKPQKERRIHRDKTEDWEEGHPKTCPKCNLPKTPSQYRNLSKKTSKKRRGDIECIDCRRKYMRDYMRKRYHETPEKISPRKYVEKLCEKCKAPFRTRSDSNGRFCGQSCAQSGTNCHFYKHGLFGTKEYTKLYDLRNPGKSDCRKITKREIRAGRLIPLPCRDCGEEKVEAHHTDYTKPLDVIWLCKFHHLMEHNMIKDESKINRMSNK